MSKYVHHKNIGYIILLFIIIFSGLIYSQQPYNFKCGTIETGNHLSLSFGQGMNKPMATLPYDDINIFFRVLIVYVEFKNDTDGAANYWAPGSLPVYANTLLAPQKELGIDAYDNYQISNYFNKISLDKFDMIGGVKHITLPNEYSYYGTSSNCYINAMSDVLKLLDTSSNINDRVNWEDYDLWSYASTTQNFEMVPDGDIDMIYVQFRRENMCGMSSGGHGSLSVGYLTINGNKNINGCGICYQGSGFMGINGWKMSEAATIGFFRHEYCHYTLGNHRPYSTILGGDGYNTICGSELGFSPQDLITVGLANVVTFQGTVNSFDLQDMLTTGEVLKVPTETAGEYFLVSNRRRIASSSKYTWDCNMTGDTASALPFLQFGDYSKGLYIYHIIVGDDFGAWVDLEAADGLWNWEHTGVTTPDWSDVQTLAVLSKTTAAYNNDDPYSAYYYDTTRYFSRDGQSVISQAQHPYPGWGQKWFSTGRRHTFLGEQGTDRIFTNLEENWCSREVMGDRWDAWSIGYNQVFSPYSSPNTMERSNSNTGIFIYYESLSKNTAAVKVYQADSGSVEEALVLELTPPSKPMMYKIEPANCLFGSANPKIIWERNREPDMLSLGTFKKYNVYRSYTLPDGSFDEYRFLTSYNDFSTEDTASFIDNTVIVNCDTLNPPVGNHYFRYKVVAVDKYGDSSVFSDFMAIRGTASWLPVEPNINEIPSKFSVTNYPNPFNPSTVIKYELPQKTFVTVNVYNILGEQVVTLVNNEFKQAGRYYIAFNGTNLSSGIYFYSITAGDYRESRKMVLVK